MANPIITIIMNANKIPPAMVSIISPCFDKGFYALTLP